MAISEESFIITFGIYVRQLREKRNLSQQGLADDCNLSSRQIGRIERGEMNASLRTIIRIANALDIEPKDLLNLPIK